MRGLRWISLVAMVAMLFVGVTVVQAAPAAQQGTGQICVLAFDDQNGNGVREADEPLLAGVGFTLADANGVKGSYKSDGNSEPYCFGSLAAGAYTVQARGVSGLEVTTPGQWAISLANAAQFDVLYGARKSGSEAARPATDGDSAAAPSSAGGMSTLGRIVLGLLGLVVLGFAGLLALTTLQRARNNR
ncbi:MAG: hypothetical protein HY870_14490 [Chloroflexi bacterium]|nr:hypothetical protein [Chloroflexota bacterium]